jgi:xanthine dehydrogenase accessory factor
VPLDILSEVQRLRVAGCPFALATVVAARQPASGTPGARAIITAEGTLEGWVGGHCVQPTIIREGLAALADGRPRLVVLSPDVPPDASSKDGVVSVAMTCAGQGALQIFVEPFLPKAELVVIGSSPVATTLARLANVMDFEVWACDPNADTESFPNADRVVDSLEALSSQLTARSYVVVATFGHYDEAAIQTALESPASYVGVVASRKRLAALQTYLRESGVSDERLQRLKRPQGLPGTMHQPAEIAFSVMAELLEARRQRVGLSMDAVAAQRLEAIDPICGMTVDVATATYQTERDGQTYYFCCKGCQARFEST